MTIVDIAGIPVKPGQKLPCRQECSVWAKDHENNIQVSLFIRALQKFYDLDFNDKLSFFQIAAIHGYPGDLEWDGAGPPKEFKNDEKDKHFIYCTHNTPLFPAWHRPYMLLFEQRLYELMLDVIEDFRFDVASEKQEWLEQRDQFRLPYWDWGLVDFKGIPDIFETPTITIRKPISEDSIKPNTETVSNPLDRYQMRDTKGVPVPMGQLPPPYKVDNDDVLPWSQCSGTSRWAIFKDPVPQDQSEGINKWNDGNQAIRAHQFYHKGGDTSSHIEDHPVSELVYRLLAPGSVPTWKAFSTTMYMKTPTDWTDYINVEYIHNNLHNFIGGLDLKSGLGHMSDVPVAAFDPVFFMHHCNIDRQIAIWQTLNPNAWFDETSDDDNSTSLPPGGNTELIPFRHKTETGEYKFWTPDAVRDWTKLGYTYDVLEKIDGETPEQYRTRVIASLDRYRNTGQDLIKAPNAIFGDHFSAKKHEYPDYILTVIYDRYALQGAPYTIHFFLGQVSDAEINNSTTSANFHESHIAYVHNFSAPLNIEKPKCANCAVQAESGALSTALVPLTSTLSKLAIDTDYDGLHDITNETIEDYMTRELTWKATDITGNVVDPSRLHRTKIMVLKGKAKHFSQAEKMSEYYGYSPMPEVTEHKEWGATGADYAHPADGL